MNFQEPGVAKIVSMTPEQLREYESRPETIQRRYHMDRCDPKDYRVHCGRGCVRVDLGGVFQAGFEGKDAHKKAMTWIETTAQFHHDRYFEFIHAADAERTRKIEAEILARSARG